MGISADDVEACRDACVGYLNGVQDHDWSTAIPGLDGTVSFVMAHQCQVLFWYSLDLAARGQDVAAAVPEIDASMPASKLTETFKAAATMLSAVVRSAPEEARGFHPFGRPDPAGFAAMGCDEMIVHTHDISRALGVDFTPPTDLTARLLARLFPWIEGDEDPWTLLQYANGRMSLDGRDQLNKWRWHCEPIFEWDGTTPQPV